MHQKIKKTLIFFLFCTYLSGLSGSLDRSMLISQATKRLDALYSAQKFYHYEQATHATLSGKIKHTIDLLFFHHALMPHKVQILSLIDQEITKSAQHLSRLLNTEPLSDEEEKEVTAFFSKPISYVPSLLSKQRGILYTSCVLMMALAGWHLYAQQHPEINKSPQNFIKNIKLCLDTFLAHDQKSQSTGEEKEKHSALYKMVNHLANRFKALGLKAFSETNPDIQCSQDISLEEAYNLVNKFERKYMELEEATTPSPSFMEKIIPYLASIHKAVNSIHARLEVIDSFFVFSAARLLDCANILKNGILPFTGVIEQAAPYIGAGIGYTLFNRLYTKAMIHHKHEAITHIQIHLSEGKRSDINEALKTKHVALFWYWTDKLQKISTSSYLTMAERQLLQPLCYSLDDPSLSLSTKLLLVKNYSHN